MSDWRDVSVQFHDELKKAMARHSGQALKTSQIKRIVEGTPSLAEDAQFLYPSDHCINHTNKGACYCAETEKAIFEKVKRGLYCVRKQDMPKK
jgi:hypothetical protein